MDHMPNIIRIVRDAIKDGLIKGEKLKVFNHKVKTLKGNELEDYIQQLWDKV
jgi:hypothetical protein